MWVKESRSGRLPLSQWKAGKKPYQARLEAPQGMEDIEFVDYEVASFQPKQSVREAVINLRYREPGPTAESTKSVKYEVQDIGKGQWPIHPAEGLGR